MIADTTFSLEKLANMFATASMLFIAVLVIDACVGGVTWIINDYSSQTQIESQTK